MQCPKCHYIMDALDLDCPRCRKFAALPKPKKAVAHCPHCGAKNSFESAPTPGQTVRCGGCKQNFPAGTGDRFDTVFGNSRSSYVASPPAVTTVMPATVPTRTESPRVPVSLDNSFVWALAFAPVATAFILSFLSSSMRWDEDTVSMSVWVFPWLINIGLCLADHKKLKESGHDTTGLDGFVCWLVPIYLFMRAEKFNQSNSYAWAWIASFAISFMIPIYYYIPPMENF
jgi:transposase-like protein